MAIKTVFNRSFRNQSDYFRQKLAIPTERWDDIMKEQHDHAFVVAGAMKADLLNDFKKTLQQVLDDGKSINWFRQNFDDIVQKQGWKGWKGSDSDSGYAWRTNLIYSQNLRSSHAAGRFEQMTDPDVLEQRPYWRYVHRSVLFPREEHQKWHNLILPADDPFWDEHYPPQGFGCDCIVESCSKRDLAKYGKAKPDRSPVIKRYTYTNPETGESHSIPEGVSPGFNYAPGRSATILALQAQMQKIASLDNAIASKNVDKLVNSDVFLKFYDGQLSGQFPVSVLTPEKMQQLSARNQMVVMTRKAIQQLHERYPALTAHELRAIQQQIPNVQWDKKGMGSILLNGNKMPAKLTTKASGVELELL